MAYTIRIAKRVTVAAPDHIRGTTFQPGQTVTIHIVDYPGKLHQQGTAGWHTSPNHAHEHWAFWTDADIDGALIFKAEHIDRLVVPADADISTWPEAPFTIERAP